MRIIFIGSVLFSKRAFLHLIYLKADIVGVVTKSSSEFNSDFEDLSVIAQNFNIPFKHVKDVNHENNVKWISEKNPDIIFCFGWSTLLKPEILHLAPMGVLGFHPALLPNNRGRHPLIWAKVLGLDKTGSTFFFMDEFADTGNILSQVEIPILFEDDALILYNKMIDTAILQMTEFLPQLQKNTFALIFQNRSLGNSWRKRCYNDGFIDFRMSTNDICNLIRALTRPYIGAHCFYNGKEIKIWEVEPGYNQKTNIEPGKVIGIVENTVEIKTGNGSVFFVEHDFIEIPKIESYLNL